MIIIKMIKIRQVTLIELAYKRRIKLQFSILKGVQAKNYLKAIRGKIISAKRKRRPRV